MPPSQQNRPRPRNDAEDAMLLVWLLLFVLVYWL